MMVYIADEESSLRPANPEIASPTRAMTSTCPVRDSSTPVAVAESLS